MEQSELNTILQKWLEGLQQVSQQQQEKPSNKPENDPLLAEGDQELSNVLDKLGACLKITGPLKTSLHSGGTHLSVLARSLSCYLSVALDQRDIDGLAGYVHVHVANIMIGLIGLDINKPLASIYHDDVRDGYLRAIQMALYRKYDKMGTDGLLAAATKPPVIYLSARGEIEPLYSSCVRAGLPQSSLSIIPCSTVHGSTHSLDTNALEKKINEDNNVGKTPLMVVAYAGTPLAGHIDDLVTLRGICDQYNMWLHVTGHGLSSLCLPEERDEIKGFSDADSFTLFPGTWFGILSSPKITFHKHPKVITTSGVPTPANFPGENPDLSSKDFAIPQSSWLGLYPRGLSKLLALPLWLCMQYLGESALVDTVSYCRGLTKNMMKRLDEIPGITRLAIPSHTSYVILFKYSGSGQLVLPPSFKSFINPVPHPQEQKDSSSDQESGSSEKGDKEGSDTQPPEDDEGPLVVTIHGMPLVLTNLYNVMISKDLQALFPKVGIVTYDMGGKDGIVFHFDPITSFPEYSTSIEDIEKFAEELKQKIDTIYPITQARCLFEVVLRRQSNLRWLEFPNIHCVAIMQYVKSDFIEKQELTFEEVNMLNKLNIELCQHLNNESGVSVFQPFQHGNFTCVLLRELPKEVDMFALLENVITGTKNFEKQKEELQGLEEKIRQGIIAAQEDLSKEKEKFEEEESVLKYVPLVGSVVSWLYPTSPGGVKGRSFNLASGKVQTSEKVYQHKMQVVDEKEEKGEEEGGNDDEAPPSKETTPVKPVTPPKEVTPTPVPTEA
ncbi:PREDICTED: pyridoxal-dependent decarboxylase domain-containing protein 1-like [Amphimedon queenslandica]|uniref:Pyridoxal-dependent decarboxylase domain-containing protein 1 n=1 Tax=Amphimedon queenslandica TaxID=400682 RepID=A0A1X7U916_AMPQE|nr:PREDICTED: pyridoxal-dependent decarboxylase domain-containing protein 1-like [Amphimedon queenslandica]|eukprot:XP_019855616.1 PREDICTED: pyridoxal-dependent decarboxylase domain-containing protein 1-like [Amphimedon queenslandica]